jgi:Predicted transcriptional regulator
MNNDTRLAVATHILALLSFAGKEYRSSDLLALSVNTNPVVVRRLTSQLKKAGLVEVRRRLGGTTLNRRPEDITLLDVYKAVVPKTSACPFYLHRTPNCDCYIGRNIHEALETPFAMVNQAMRESLAKTTIADIAAFIRVRETKEKANGNSGQ